MLEQWDKYEKGGHTVWECKYHVVWIPKYRLKILVGDIKEYLKMVLMQECENLEVEILKGETADDHLHLAMQIPPKHSVAHVMQEIKRKSANRLVERYPEIGKRYWGQHIWVRGYFVSTVGIDEETIRKYIEMHAEKEMMKNQAKLWAG